MKTKLLSVLMVFAMSLTAAMAAGAVYWVSPAGTGDGSSSGAASSDVLAVVTGATEAGDEVRFFAGEYSFSAPIVISAAKGLTLSGGYGAAGSEGGGETIIKNDPSLSSSHKLIDAKNSTLTIRDISFVGGFDNQSDGSVYTASGVFLNNCVTTVEDCRFSENGYRSGTKNKNGTNMGALGAYQGSLVVSGCDFRDNVSIDHNVNGAGNCARMRGGAVSGVAMTNTVILSSYFADNGINPYAPNSGGGGAVSVRESKYDVIIRDCVFTNNFSRTGVGDYLDPDTFAVFADDTSRGPYGGALALNDNTDTSVNISVVGCFFAANWCSSTHSVASEYDYGGTIYFGSNNGLISDCVFVDGGRVPYSEPAADAENRTSIRHIYNNAAGGVAVNGRNLTIRNSLFAGMERGEFVSANGAANITIVNSTFVKGKQNTVAPDTYSRTRSVLKVLDGSISARNSIFWDNISPLYNTSSGVTLYNCIIPEGTTVSGSGNISADPCFTDDRYFHTASLAGSYHGDYFGDEGSWYADEVHSPAIDAGASADDASEEPFPNGGIVNIGYDGGTDKASRSLLGDNPFVDPEVPSITVFPSDEAVGDSVAVRAMLLSLGSEECATVTVAWGAQDCGDELSAWSNTKVLPGSYTVGEEINCVIDGIIADESVCYRLFATLPNGTVCVSLANTGERGTIYFCASESIGTGDGLSIQNASSDIAAIIEKASSEEAGIVFLEGEYSLSEPITIASAKGLTLSGGYGADGSKDGGETIIKNDPSLSSSHKLIDAKNSTLTIRGISFVGGFDNQSDGSVYTASGVFLNNCVTTIEDCRFSENGYRSGTKNKNGTNMGAIGAYQGSLVVSGCDFRDNVSFDHNVNTPGNCARMRGGAIGVVAATNVSITSSYFADNGNNPYAANSGGGGAIAVRESQNNIYIGDCVFTNNFARTGIGEYDASTFDDSTRGPYGGALAISDNSNTKITIERCRFEANWANTSKAVGSEWQYGGTIYIANDATISNCEFINPGLVPYSEPPTDAENRASIRYLYNNSSGAIDIHVCKVTIKNSLIRGSQRGHVLSVNSSAAVNIINTTIVDTQHNSLAPDTYGRTRSVYKHQLGSASFVNCIIWDYQNLYNSSSGLSFSYSLAQTLQNGTGNLAANPKFKSPTQGNYNLGGYSPAKNAGNNDALTSDMTTDIEGKPRIYKGVVDLGCYESVVKPTILTLQ